MALWVPEGHDVVLSLTEALKRPTFAKAPEKCGGFKGRLFGKVKQGWKIIFQKGGKKQFTQSTWLASGNFLGGFEVLMMLTASFVASIRT